MGLFTHAYPIILANIQGFGNDAVDYLNPLELGKEESFAAALRRRGFDVFVVVRGSTPTRRCVCMGADRIGLPFDLPDSPPPSPPPHKQIQPVKRTDWLKFGSGLFTADFWSQKMTARNPSFNWYLGKVEGTVEEAVAASGGDRALIVGHSAGACACLRCCVYVPKKQAPAHRPTNQPTNKHTPHFNSRRVARPRRARGRGVGGLRCGRGL